MKTKNLIIIFVIFLSITLASGLAVSLTKEKKQSVLSQRSGPAKKQAELAVNKPVQAAASAFKDKKIVEPINNLPLNAKPKETIQPETVKQPAEEKIKVVIFIGSDKYEAAIKPGSSVYDLMNLLKAENKIYFSGKNYAGLGFFVEAINGLKNNPAGENWLYYINGRPAPAGVSNYLINNNDIIEWKYEKKSF